MSQKDYAMNYYLDKILNAALVYGLIFTLVVVPQILNGAI